MVWLEVGVGVVVVGSQLDNDTGMNEQSHGILPLPDWKDRELPLIY
jgi:hypothetical protein